MKIIKHILAIILGIIAAFAAIFVETFVISFLGSIPIIGALLYFPSDASWILTVAPPITFSFVAAWVGLKIARSAKPVSVVTFSFWVLSFIIMFTIGTFGWDSFISYSVGVFSSAICFSEFNDAD